MKHRHEQQGYARRGRPLVASTLRIEPVCVREPSLERLAQVLERYASSLTVATTTTTAMSAASPSATVEAMRHVSYPTAYPVRGGGAD